MVKATFVFVSLAVVLSSCADGIEMDLVNTPASVDSAQIKSLPLSPDQICSDVAVVDQTGTKVQGTRDCAPQKSPCRQLGDVDCLMVSADLYGIHDAKLTPKALREGVRLGAGMGQAKSDHGLCQNDGDVNCALPKGMVAVDVATIAGKTIKGQSLAGVAGSHEPVFPSRSAVLSSDTVNGQPGLLSLCQRPGQANCVATAQLRAVATAQLSAANIRAGQSIGGVTGSYQGRYSACQANNDSACLATPAFVAMTKNTLAAGKIRQNIVLGDVTGTLTERPSDCGRGGQAACVTTASFPAADQSLMRAANFKRGAQVSATSGAITGAYPSAAHPLPSADAAVSDLTAGNLNSSLSSAAAFEFWDSTGSRHQAQGDDQLSAAHLSRAVTVFGVTGQVEPSPQPCTASLRVGCVTSPAHPSYDERLLVPGNIKAGTQILAVTGAYPSAAFPLPAADATADLLGSTFTSQVADHTKSFEYWDSQGRRHTATGSAELVPGHLSAGSAVFGVAGTLQLRPADCSDSRHVGCVTTTSHPAYDPAIITAAKIKAGVQIGEVTGAYPSASFPLAGAASGIADLSSSTFAAQLRSPSQAPFEFWDAAGNRYQRNGSNLLSANHLKQGQDIFGVLGTLAPRGAECQSAGDQGCVAVSSFPAYNQAALVPAIIKTGAVVMGVTGAYPSASHPLADATATADLGNEADLHTKLQSSASFEYWDSNGSRQVSAGDDNFRASHIASGVTILGLAGTLVTAPSGCAADGEASCVATASFPAVDSRSLTADIIKAGVTLGGITGEYPSATAPLAGASGATDLKGGAAFGGLVTTAGSVEYFDHEGRRYSQATTALVPAELKTGVTLFGVAGAATPSPNPCTAATVTGCVTTSGHPSYQAGQISAGVLKAGVQIGGVTGAYPSSSFPLASATATTDLDFNSFTARIKSQAPFEFWDAAGNRFVRTGSGEISPTNILVGQTIFNATGVLQQPNVVPVPADKVRIGVRTGPQQGSLKISCANTATGPSADKITVDDFNGDSSIPSHEIFGSDRSCRQGTFVDQRLGGFSCNGLSRRCIFKDTLSGLSWYGIKLDMLGIQVFMTLADAHAYCSSITANGGGWRLPTQKELFTAFAHGLRQASLANTKLFPWGSKLWTSTKSSSVDGEVKIYRPRDLRQYDNEDRYMRNLCVKGP